MATYMVVGRTFSPAYFTNRADAEEMVNGLPDAMVKYDGEIAIVEVGKTGAHIAPVEYSDWGEEWY